MSSVIAHLMKRGGYSTTELDSNKNKQLDIIMSFLVAKQPWSTVGIMVAKWFPAEEDWTRMSFFVNRGDITETEKTLHLNYYLNQQEATSMTESERTAREAAERTSKEAAERTAREAAEKKAKEDSERKEMDRRAEIASLRFWDGCIPGVYHSGFYSAGPCLMGGGGVLITDGPVIRRVSGPSMMDATPFGRPGPTPVSWSEIISATPSHHFGGGGGGGGIGLSSLAPPVINYRGGR